MGRSGDSEEADREIWGTWEELLLASAVSRHGTSSWDAVALEVQSRSPFAHLLTPSNCRLRYLHLHRRFSSDAAAAWVEELRKLRVAELRREVERCDLSIVSLELKLNRLKEERERGLNDPDPSAKDHVQTKTG